MNFVFVLKLILPLFGSLLLHVNTPEQYRVSDTGLHTLYVINAKQQHQSREGLQPDQGPIRILRQSPHSRGACLGRELLLLLLPPRRP